MFMVQARLKVGCGLGIQCGESIGKRLYRMYKKVCTIKEYCTDLLHLL